MATAQSPTAANIARSPQNGLGRLAAWCYDHRRRVLAGWLLAVVAIIGLAQWAGSRLDNNFALAGRGVTAFVGGETAAGVDTSAYLSDRLPWVIGLITAAAAIMVCVFGSFVIGDPLRILGVFGLGLAVAVLVDATVVRLILVPAVMQLLGTANWWLPRWMARAIPSLSIEPDADQLARRPGLRPAGQRKGRRAIPAIPAGGAAAVESRSGTRERRDQDAR